MMLFDSPGRIRACFTLLVFLLLFILAAACSANQAAPATQTPLMPQLRIINNSPNAIRNLTVIFPDQRISFGDVGGNATTDYRDAPGGVYRYAAYEYEVDGQRITQPVIDWVGEEPVPGKRFTYTLDYLPNASGRLPIELVSASVDEE